MPALACISPRVLKRILELRGFAAQHEDDYNWALMKPGLEEVVIVPKLGDLVAVEVLHRALDAAQMDNAAYFELLERANAES